MNIRVTFAPAEAPEEGVGWVQSFAQLVGDAIVGQGTDQEAETWRCKRLFIYIDFWQFKFAQSFGKAKRTDLKRQDPSL